VRSTTEALNRLLGRSFDLNPLRYGPRRRQQRWNGVASCSAIIGLPNPTGLLCGRSRSDSRCSSGGFWDCGSTRAADSFGS
jgi:hypothetical protein